MAKRFTDTEKWKKAFYKKLTPAYKCFWNFITDDCDHNGVWEVEDEQILAIRIGEKINLDSALAAFNEDEKRIHIFDAGRKWFIIPFVTFQYGNLNPKNRLHEAVRAYLDAKGLLALTPVRGPLSDPLERVKEKDKDKEKVKETVKKEDFNQLEAFETVWNEYPVRGRLKRSASLRLWCEIAVNRDIVSRVQKSIKNYAEHLKANDWKLPQEFPNWLEAWPDWENYKEPEKPGFEKREKKPNPDCSTCNGTGKLPDGRGKCWCWS